ncbi:MAG: hypothetical protein K9M45_06910 [Kiritimatiellales bacterium]|nr:hypothetical protein [Kiritimatiellales bacterium]
MKSLIDDGEVLRLCNRHKARTLTKLEELNCPDGFLEIIRNGFGYLRSDLVELAIKSKRRE